MTNFVIHCCAHSSIKYLDLIISSLEYNTMNTILLQNTTFKIGHFVIGQVFFYFIHCMFYRQKKKAAVGLLKIIAEVKIDLKIVLIII